MSSKRDSVLSAKPQDKSTDRSVKVETTPPSDEDARTDKVAELGRDATMAIVRERVEPIVRKMQRDLKDRQDDR